MQRQRPVFPTVDHGCLVAGPGSIFNGYLAGITMEDDNVGLARKAICVAENLYKFCVAIDDGKRLRETGCIPPASTLKNRKCRDAFMWARRVNQYNQRFFTMAAVRMGIIRMLDTYSLNVPIVNGMTFEVWLIQQSKLVLHLCQRARKNSGSSLRFLAYRQSTSMDWMDTVPMEAGYLINLVVAAC